MSSRSALDQALAYIELNYMDDLTIEDLVRVSGVSKFALNRLFQRDFCMSPLKWVGMFRTTIATIALEQSPKLTCREIAYSCGFETPSHFARVFRNVVGKTPNEYRMESKVKLRCPVVDRAKRAFLVQAGYFKEMSLSANT